MTASTVSKRSESAWPAGISNGMPVSLILTLARERRRFIVSSETRNARAISSVVRPPTARRISATWASSASAGWQQVKTNSSRSSPITVSSSSSMVASGTSSRCSLRASVRSRRIRSIARLRAVTISQPAGLAESHARPALGRGCERLLDGFLGEVEVAEEADRGGQHPAPLLAKDLLEQRYCSTTGRTSTDPPSRAAGIAEAISRTSSRLAASRM